MASSLSKRKLRLANPGRPQEDERADRPPGILEAGARAAHGLRDDLDRIVLADQARVDLIFHSQQAGGLLLDEA